MQCHRDRSPSRLAQGRERVSHVHTSHAVPRALCGDDSVCVSVCEGWGVCGRGRNMFGGADQASALFFTLPGLRNCFQLAQQIRLWPPASCLVLSPLSLKFSTSCSCLYSSASLLSSISVLGFLWPSCRTWRHRQCFLVIPGPRPTVPGLGPWPCSLRLRPERCE